MAFPAFGPSCPTSEVPNLFRKIKHGNFTLPGRHNALLLTLRIRTELDILCSMMPESHCKRQNTRHTESAIFARGCRICVATFIDITPLSSHALRDMHLA